MPLKMKIAFTLGLLVLLNALLLANASGQPPVVRTLADQPDKQRNAVKRILELGGDWESPRKTVLIGFIGDKFTNETFSLLEPLADVKHLAFFNVPADDSAFKHYENLENVEWLDITTCKFNGTGLRHFSKCEKLRNIYIAETSFTDEALEILAKFPSIETLTIENVYVPSRITSEGVRKLSALKNVRQLDIDMAENPADLEAEMKAVLPNCEFSLTQSPAIRK